MIFAMCGMYASHRLSSRRDEMLDLVKATTMGSCSCNFPWHYDFRIKLIMPEFMVAFWAAGVLASVIEPLGHAVASGASASCMAGTCATC